MNPIPEPADRDRRLRRTLDASAAGLDLGPAAPRDIATRGRRRHRHRRLIGGGAVLALVAGSAAVLASGSDDSTVSTSDSVPSTATPTTVQAPDAISPTTGPSTTGPSTTGPSTTEPPTSGPPPTATPAAVGAQPDDATPTVPPETSFGSLVPFGDGFAMVTTRTVTPPLPDRLPPEIRDLFSEEAIALFADGLPPTIEEATRILDEAGLLGEVTEVITNHPEASDAIYGSGPATQVTEIWTTGDGETWALTEVPGGRAYRAALPTSDGLVAWSTEPSSDQGSTVVSLVATDDLSDWRFAEFALGPDPDAPSYLDEVGWVDTVVTVGDHWFALAEVSRHIDWLEVLPPDVRSDIDDRAFGLTYDEESLTVDYVTGEGKIVRSFDFVELGLPDGPREVDGLPQQRLFTGTFGGAPAAERIDLPSNSALGDPLGATARSLHALPSGELVYIGSSVFRSVDGRSWTESAALPVELVVTGSAPLGDRVLIAGRRSDVSAPAFMTWDPVDGLVEIAGPDVPGDFGLWGRRASPTWVVDSVTTTPAPPIEFEFEHDGLQYEIVDDRQTFTLVVTDAATGDVVVDRIIPTEERTQLFDTLGAGDQETVAVTDDDGTEIARLPSALVVNAYLDAQTAGVSEPARSDHDRWLIATADGVGWSTIDLVDPDDESVWSAEAVLNGRTLLVRDHDDWSVETLP
ncbi:MAG: hypothetical protein RIB65_00715 [Ilumatobacter fluminis]|uniref:hypothetical protein n=1 Tax=Ilumatobacter fluminis TaxID=467091 RepID=UPI0032EF1B5D